MSNQSVNEVTLLGNAGSDPVVSGEGKQPFASLSLATSKSWKDKEENAQEKVTWHKIVFFGKSADFIKAHVKKGSYLFIRGELEQTQWQDKEGVTRYETQIISKEWPILLDKKSSDHLEFVASH